MTAKRYSKHGRKPANEIETIAASILSVRILYQASIKPINPPEFLDAMDRRGNATNHGALSWTLKRMERQGWLESTKSATAGADHFSYSMTSAGREALKSLQGHLEQLGKIIGI